MASLFTKWQQEHFELSEELDAYRDRLQGMNGCGENSIFIAIEQLEQTREILVNHFVQEDLICRELREHYPTGSVEVEANYRQTCQEHEELLAELDNLVEQLGRTEAMSEPWESVIYAVGLFLDRVEQHEECEAEHIGWLAPNK